MANIDFITSSERPLSKLSENHKMNVIGPTEPKLWPFKDALLNAIIIMIHEHVCRCCYCTYLSSCVHTHTHTHTPSHTHTHTHPPTHNTELERCLHNRLKDFHDLLLRRPQGYPHSVMSTTAGDLDPPLGNTRLQVVRLFASILQCGSSGISTAMMQLRTFSTLVVSLAIMSLTYLLWILVCVVRV